MIRASACGVGLRLFASRLPVRFFAKRAVAPAPPVSAFRRSSRSNKDESSVLADQHVTLILSDNDAVEDLLSAVLGRVVSLAEKPIAPRTLHLRGVPGKAKEFSYDCFAVLRDPSASVKGVGVAHLFRHALIEGQNESQNYVASRAMMHAAINRYESFVARIIDKVKIKARKSPAQNSSLSCGGTPAVAKPAPFASASASATPAAAQLAPDATPAAAQHAPDSDATVAVATGLGASSPSTGDCDGAHHASSFHPNRSPVQHASFEEVSPSVVVTIQDYAPVALRAADVQAAASSRGVPDAVLDAWCAARTVPGSSGTLLEHLAENLKHDTGVLTVDVRVDLPRNTFVLPANAVNAGDTKAEELSYVLLTIPVAGCPLPVTSVKLAMEALPTATSAPFTLTSAPGVAVVSPSAAAPLAGAAPLGAAPLSTPLASGYEPADVAYLRNHDNYVFVYLPLLICLKDFAPLKHLWRHGGGGSADDLDRLHKWALLLRHKPAKPEDAPPLIRSDDLLNK